MSEVQQVHTKPKKQDSKLSQVMFRTYLENDQCLAKIHEIFKSLYCDQIVVTRERGEQDNKKHLHGLVHFSRQIRITTILNKFSPLLTELNNLQTEENPNKNLDVHFESIKDFQSSWFYICGLVEKKGSKFNPPVLNQGYEYLPKEQIHADDPDDFIFMSKVKFCPTVNDFLRQYPTMYQKYHNAIEKYYNLGDEETTKWQKNMPADYKSIVIWRCGNSGQGKTYTVTQKYSKKQLYCKRPDTKWFEGYAGQEVVLFDELRCTSMNFDSLLQVLDGKGLNVEIKGGTVWFHPALIYVTCPNKPDVEFSSINVKRNFNQDLAFNVDQLLRRIDAVEVYDAEGKVTAYDPKPQNLQKEFHSYYDPQLPMDNVPHDENNPVQIQPVQGQIQPVTEEQITQYVLKAQKDVVDRYRQ